MKSPFLLPALLLGGVLGLSACSSQPQQVQLQPTVNLDSVAQHSIIAAIKSQDLRSNRFLISIHQDGEEQAQLIASGSNLRQSIEQQLSASWQQQGVGFVPDSPNLITIELLELASKVEESSVKHAATSTMRIKVTVDTPHKTLAKQFRSTHTNEGAFSVNVNKQADAMSQQLSELLTQIASDPQLIEVLEYQL
ncbi:MULTISPECIES: YajG family lipoprotein [unclassified Agarivorans]|uniref:YajG family lipoprotein n=1 Tax=unclassified Agarivorans TaxID=2636026 RepID=UPI0026E494A5|nr:MULTISPECIES: YajG family lipoprotein [unclassified Agarivorans]MDO6684044.1 YajG family lipoprotein [Agarivorans sp. 3_MG-2023]MDO6714222.1 YajG family lipoprotein [Agarivorans sp. 2_MG-2023]